MSRKLSRKSMAVSKHPSLGHINTHGAVESIEHPHRGTNHPLGPRKVIGQLLLSQDLQHTSSDGSVGDVSDSLRRTSLGDAMSANTSVA